MMKEKMLPIVIKIELIETIETYYKQQKRNVSSMGIIKAIALYSYFYKVARVQATNKIYANEKYLCNKLEVSAPTLQKIKKDLAAMELIKIIPQKFKGKGNISKGYIQVNKIWKQDTMKKIDDFQPEARHIIFNLAKEILRFQFPYDSICSAEDIGAENDEIEIKGKNNTIDIVNPLYFYVDEDNYLCCVALYSTGNEISMIVPTILVEKYLTRIGYFLSTRNAKYS